MPAGPPLPAPIAGVQRRIRLLRQGRVVVANNSQRTMMQVGAYVGTLTVKIKDQLSDGMGGAVATTTHFFFAQSYIPARVDDQVVDGRLERYRVVRVLPFPSGTQLFLEKSESPNSAPWP
jgi:hypothetical protein